MLGDRITVKQAAKLLNVSERLIYKARRVRQLRPDLGPLMERGELTVTAALRIAEGKDKQPPDTWKRLVSAWNAATEEERLRLWWRIGDRPRKPIEAGPA